MVETGRADAFVMDDILLYGLVAQLARPRRLRDLRRGALAAEPYGIMLRKDDSGVQEGGRRRDGQPLQEPARSTRSTTSGSRKPIPPKGINLNVPMSAADEEAVRQSDRLGDPTAYK